MRTVLKQPGVSSALLTSGIAMLPMGALGLLLILHVRDVTGSYAQAGAVSATTAIFVGLSAPVLARWADRHGQVAILRVGAPLAAAAITAQALLPAGAPLTARLALAMASGIGQPPVGAFRRRLWNEIVPEGELRHRTYAIEGALMEVVYILGPVVIVSVIGSFSVVAGLLVCAAAMLVGNLAFSRLPAVHALRGDPDAVRDLAGALRAPGIVVAFLTFVTLGMAVGAAEVGVPATLEEMGHRDLTGVCLGLWGVGSLLAGVAMSRTRAPERPERVLVVCVGLWGLLHGAVALAWSPAVVAVALLLAGATIAPTFTVLNGLLDRIALPGTLTEAFVWTSTGMVVGIAGGGALAGTLADHVSPTAAVALGGAGVLGAVLVGFSQRALSQPPPVQVALAV